MPSPILPESFCLMLMAFQGCFHAPSYANFQWLVAGWVQCLGRRTITAVAVAAGAVGERHISVFHRFFARAQWTLDAVGRVVFQLALHWIPADQPLHLLGDDTLTRKSGQWVSLAAMHHDPLLSSRRKPFFSFGHVWVVLALWVPLPMGEHRGFALPILVRLSTGAKRGGRADAPSRQTTGKRQRVAEQAHAERDRRTKLELLREMVGLVAEWAEERPLYLEVDSAYAGRMTLENRPRNVEVVSRLRLDAALWAPAPKRRPGRKGRPRRRGTRLPTPQQIAARCRRWQTVSVTIYGRTVTTPILTLRALWYAALGEAPVRIVLVRDPSGKRRDEAFFCTDLSADAVFILEAYARRWCLEVTFHDAKQFLGLADPQCQAPRAVQRTAPLAFVVYDLVLLWFAEHAHSTTSPVWPVRPWYRHKTTPSFPDMLETLRRAGWQAAFSEPPCPPRRLEKSSAPPPDHNFRAA
ncbi:MAG: transposase [Chloroflexota bacterium]|nr:transposase [Chloroflexota bacterium]